METIFRRNHKEAPKNVIVRAKSEYKLKDTYQGISLPQVEGVLKFMGKYTDDLRDAVWCLLNDEFPSLFSRAGDRVISEGATIFHIGNFIGVFMRNSTSLDREGRDAWVKPLREVGAVEACTYFHDKGFLVGHLIAKSKHSCYRLSESFIQLIKEYDKEEFEASFKSWISKDKIRDRLAIQADLEKANRETLQGNPHQNLIQYSITLYSKHFLPGYLLIYKDDADGDRISNEEKALMQKYGIELGLADAMPDVILYHPGKDSLWFIEAVTSDGEVDEHKLKGVMLICEKSGKVYGGSTTTYLKWKTFATRQQTHKNLADTSKVWIHEDPQKEFEVRYLRGG